MKPLIFTQCSCCRKMWKDRDEFLEDPAIELKGYRVDFEDLNAGVFVFDHKEGETCCSIELTVYEFEDLYDGEIFEENKTGSDECPGYCLRSDIFDRCPAQCECAYVREVMQIIVYHIKAMEPLR